MHRSTGLIVQGSILGSFTERFWRSRRVIRLKRPEEQLLLESGLCTGRNYYYDGGAVYWPPTVQLSLRGSNPRAERYWATGRRPPLSRKEAILRDRDSSGRKGRQVGIRRRGRRSRTLNLDGA